LNPIKRGGALMQELKDRILKEGRNLGKGILKVDSFLNHQIDPLLMTRLGQELARRLAHTQPTKVLTAETSGIAPALAAAAALGVPLVFARKRPPLTMDYTIVSENARSRTQGKIVELMVSTEYLRAGDRVLIIDDFLATAQTITALARLVEKVGAQVVGIGTVIEKHSSTGARTRAISTCRWKVSPSSRAWTMARSCSNRSLSRR
jgi:xanthine phosphoribosyltransferase